uniref:Uncharacterized protein n=1 Tax=Anopheles merus TaxID=30066 RepID=A0A182UQ58_ANOME
MLFGSIFERGSTWRVSELLSVAEICDDIGDMLRLPAPPTPGPTPATADDDADCPVASTSAPAGPLAASSRFRSLNDLFATISAISGLDVRHSIGSRSMCFLARGIGCRGSVVLPASSPELSVPVPPGPPSLPCLISSSMIFSSASCFCFFSCSFCWMFTREPTLLPSFSLEPPILLLVLLMVMLLLLLLLLLMLLLMWWKLQLLVGLLLLKQLARRSMVVHTAPSGCIRRCNRQVRRRHKGGRFLLFPLRGRIDRVRKAAVKHTRNRVWILLAAVAVQRTTPNASTDTAASLTSGASTTTASTIYAVFVPGQAAASVRGAVAGALLRHASTRLVPEPAHVEVPVVHDHKEQAGGKAAEHGQRYEIPTVRPVWPHADHPQADEQTVFRKHYHVEGQHQPVDVLQPHVLAKAGQRPAHAKQRQRGRHHVQIAERFLLLLGQIRLLHQRRTRRQVMVVMAQRFQLQCRGQLRLALQRHEHVQLEQQHRGGLAKRVHQPQHAEVAHLVLHVPQVDRHEQLRVPPQHTELGDVQREHYVPAVLGGTGGTTTTAGGHSAFGLFAPSGHALAVGRVQATAATAGRVCLRVRWPGARGAGIANFTLIQVPPDGHNL